MWADTVKNVYEKKIRQLVTENNDCLYWASVQIQHPKTKEDFYAIAGSGYEAPTENRTWITLLREVYRHIDKKCRLYDYVLFGDFPYKGDGLYKIVLATRAGKPTIEFSPSVATISYPFEQRDFWGKYTNPETPLSTANYDSFLEHLSMNMGLATDKRINFNSDNLERNLYADIEKIRHFSIESQTDNSDLLIGCLLFPWQCLYYGSIKLMINSSVQGGITIATKNEIDNDILHLLVAQLKEISINWLWELSDQYREKYAIHSAIGSIMSRNGSHNIGSHVLAALSHNVGTMPDDRVLYQYIQHRMDYMATATTERPTWTMPTKFVSSMMRRFLSQRHLLDYISRSEGLTAYQFQNPQEDTSTLECQPGTIRLHVRRIAEDDALWNRENLFAHARPVEDFIDYPKGTTSRLDRDIEVAIPVGVVGQHAFFTILENILRNAAKHEWSVAQTDAIDSAGEYAPTVDKEKPQRPVRASHLDVYVDFQDRPQNGKVDVVVWSDCGGRNFVEKACYLSPAEISARLESETSSGGLELNDLSPLQQLQVKMARPFIAADGHLHRENWGLAEMRISAGYLNLSKIDDIGGIGQSRKRFDIISPVVVESESPAPGQSEKHRCLGYEFSIPKPKELLVILPDSMIRRGEGDRIKATVEAFSAGLKRFGVELVFESTLETRSGSDAALPFSYVLFSGKPTVLEKLKLGYRLLGAPNASAWTGAQYTGRLFEENLDDLLKSEPEQFVNDLLNDVYGDWMRFVKSSYRKKKGFSDDTEFPLVIDIFGEQSKDDRAERSLISDAELLDFIFRNTFNSAVDSYLDRIDPLDELSIFDETVDRGLMVWRAPGARKVHIEATRPVFKNGVKVPDKFVKLSRSAMIRRQLENWCTRQYDDPLDRECMRKMKSWLEALDKTENASAVPKELTDFISYLEKVIVEQAKAFLSKYEERIVTLPTSMEIKCPPDNSRANDNPEKQVGGQRVIFTSSDDFKNSLEHAIAYWRHEDYKVERKNAPVYREALSGAQSYFSVFQELELAISGGSGRKPSRQEVGIVAKLVECGLFQVLIVDERVSRFVAEHQDVKDAFSHIGIDVWDADFHQTTAMFRKQDPVLPEGYDIAIVHQGVIDKRLRDDEALTSVNDFCDRMKQKVPYFAITTGRGTPSTIPPGARVLPFSVIESTLFTRYPEKFILVDTIMNLLPVGRQEEQ